MTHFILWIFILLIPVLGGFIYGFERVVRARMQNRQGPPVLQPFYDMYKLLDKQPFMVNSYHIVFALVHMIVLWIAVAMVVLGFNLLYIIFIHLTASIFLVLAGYSVRSVYSHLGSNRELMTIVAYEPVLILIAVGFYMVNGTFDTSFVWNSGSNLLSMIPLFLALLLITPIKLKKSPFDAAEAHQEIVGGIEIEYSGVFFEILYMAKWIEYIFIYSLVFLFAGDSWLLGVVLFAFVFLMVNLVDNSTARIKTTQLVKITLAIGVTLGVINIWGLSYV
ncbi:MAG: complex I subunit 1 family protein [Campylobacterota bacterium]|nr:complex I subunit 1 family protein [Campylobacterota bacterium]